ncbi:MAG: hypothetical protein WA813_22935, partial [Beijerinckiaceae bacterium]
SELLAMKDPLLARFEEAKPFRRRRHHEHAPDCPRRWQTADVACMVARAPVPAPVYEFFDAMKTA